MQYQIISDGSCDLESSVVEKNNIKVVPFYVSFDEQNYYKEIEEIGIRDFYQRMVDEPKVFPKSSLPSIQDYVDAFMPYAQNGTPIICICITIKFSGSYNSATNAADIVKETYPDAKITVIDSTVDTVLQGLYVLEAVRMQQNGLSYEDTIANLERIKSSGRILFTVGSIDYLKHGGRIGKLAGLAASTLGIKPMIILKEGEIFSNGITRGRKKSLEKLLHQIRDYFESNNEKPDDYTITIGYGYDYDEALVFKDMLLKSLSEYSHITELPMFQIGATIAVHTGPYPLGIGLLKKYDV